MSRLKLHHAILVAMAMGAALGLSLSALAANGVIAPDTASAVASAGKALGDLFLRLLQMLVVPLIATSLISGVAGLGDLRKLGRLGTRTFALYLLTTLLAVVTGLLVVHLVQPGSGVDRALLEAGAATQTLPAEAHQEAQTLGAMLFDQLVRMIPKNPIAAASNGEMLPLIFFSLLLGLFLNATEHANPDTGQDAADLESTPAKAAVVRRFFEGLFAVMMRMTLWVIALAPFGVFGFMLHATASHGLETFRALGWYALAVSVGLGIHAFVTLPLLLKFLGRRSPGAHVRAMAPALLTAFSTASSNGTLPLTMDCLERRAGVDPEVGSFVLPLGATINMDGTALYEAVAVLFIAQVYGMDLSFAQQLIVVLTALLASVGAAGIPHAGTVMMVVVLSAVGLPTTAVGLILAVDRVLDMCRTTVNVWSDSVVAAVVERLTGPVDGPASGGDAQPSMEA